MITTQRVNMVMAEEAQENCPCMQYCPLVNVQNLIGGKWKIPILCCLHNEGAMRYNALKRRISGITNTMLASALRELEESGLVVRTQYMEMPVRVEYALTQECDELMPILNKLAAWGRKSLGCEDAG